jgi:hypothetical protein
MDLLNIKCNSWSFWGGVTLSSLAISATIWPTLLVPDDDEYRVVGGMMAGKPKYSEKTLHHKFHMTLPGLKPVPPWWEAGD